MVHIGESDSPRRANFNNIKISEFIMTLKTKADIGDTIYYITDNKIISDSVNNILTNTKADNTSIAYLVNYRYEDEGYGCVAEERIALSLEELINKLRSEYFNANNIVEVCSGN